LPKISLRSIWAKTAVAVVALIAAALVFSNLRAPREKPAEATKTARVVLGYARNDPRILDANNRNVLDQLAALPGGDYLLTDAKPGFQNIRVPFHVDPFRNASPTVEAEWVPLKAFLRIDAPPGGQWAVDTTQLLPEQLQNFELAEGPHDLIWSEGANQATLPLKVSAGFVSVEKWKTTRASVFAVNIRPEGAELRLSNLKLRYQAGSMPPVETDADGTLNWKPASDPVMFQSVQNNSVIGKIPQFDPSQGGLLYVAAAPVLRSQRVIKQEQPPPAPTPAPEVQAPAPQPPPPAQKTPYQIQLEACRAAGFSADDCAKIVKKDK
jgi:hypothetical protein